MMKRTADHSKVMVGCGEWTHFLDTSETADQTLDVHIYARQPSGRLITRRETHARQHAETVGLIPTVHVNPPVHVNTCRPRECADQKADQMPTA